MQIIQSVLPAFRLLRTVALVVIASACVFCSAGHSAKAQVRSEAPTQRIDVADAISKVSSGDFAAVHLKAIADAHAVEAIPALETQFTKSDDTITKAQISSALVRLGDVDGAYWKFLEEAAGKFIDSDAPSYMTFDAQGRSQPGPSPAFAGWAKAHGIPVGQAGEDSLYFGPGVVMLLGSTEDSRAIPLLRRGLSSPNSQINVVSALGLAGCRDKDSVPLIIKAIEAQPAEISSAMASSLVYFDDAKAQAAFDRYVPKASADLLREARANGKTPFRN